MIFEDLRLTPAGMACRVREAGGSFLGGWNLQQRTWEALLFSSDGANPVAVAQDYMLGWVLKTAVEMRSPEMVAALDPEQQVRWLAFCDWAETLAGMAETVEVLRLEEVARGVDRFLTSGHERGYLDWPPQVSDATAGLELQARIRERTHGD